MPATTPPLTPDIIRALAGDRAYARGAEYLRKGRVTHFRLNGDRLTAVVLGTESYRVQLGVIAESTMYECSCPVGDDDLFCKHCVAVALMWFKQHSNTSLSVAEIPLKRKSKRVATAPPITTSNIRAHLEQLDKSELVARVINQAEASESAMRRLMLEVAGANGNAEQGVAVYKAAITAAFRVRDFVDYRAARAYADRIRQTLVPVEQLLETAQAASVIELTEHALKCLERAQQRVDDSNGHIIDIREWLHDIHFTACDQVRPEPKALARRLFARELASELDVFHGSASRYAEILGVQGLAVFRALATTEWEKVPFLQPGDNNANRYGRTFCITSMMESLAIAVGDVEELVMVKQRDLSHAYHFVQIVEVYERAEQFDAALKWAERGLVAFPKQTDTRLLEILARQYVRAGRADEAMALVWRVFTEYLSLEHYQQLQSFAEPLGTWSKWRAKALQTIRDSMAAHAAKATLAKRVADISGYGSLLVEIFVAEDTPDLAWQEAQRHGCSADWWMRLAHLREADHPDDAVHIYQNEVARVLQHADKRAYRDGVMLLRDVARALKRAGREHEFVPYVGTVRAANKARKNFIALLDAEY